MFQNTVKFNSYPQKNPYNTHQIWMTTPSQEHLHFTDSLNRCGVMRSGQGVFEDASFLPRSPLFSSHTPRSPPLLGLSSELHVARLPTASCDKPSCPLTTSFLMLAGKTRGVAANPHTHTRTHTEFKGTSSKKKKSFQMTKHRLLDECLLRLFFVFSVFSSEVHHCISVYLSFPFFLPLLCIDICISVFIGCPVFLSLRSIFIFFFLLLLSVFLFPSCFTVFYCFCLGFNFLFTLSVQSVCLSLSL